MTVQEMIDALNKIEDKTKEVIWVQDYELVCSACEIDELQENDKYVSVNGYLNNNIKLS